MVLPAAAAVAVTAAFYALLVSTHPPCGVDGRFCGGNDGTACSKLRHHLETNLHGQAVAVDLLSDAICDHLESRDPGKPLVIALHGPPGVGKSYFHRLLAQAVYGAVGTTWDEEEAEGGNVDEASREDDASRGRDTAKDASSSWQTFTTSWVRKGYGTVQKAVTPQIFFGGQLDTTHDPAAHCPGADCPSYKVVFGIDYVASEEAVQSAKLQDSLLTHLRQYPESVLVIEEYDKMGCAARGMLRQLLEKGVQHDGAAFKKTIFVLEANAGFTEIKKKMDSEMAAASLLSHTTDKSSDDSSPEGGSNPGRTAPGKDHSATTSSPNSPTLSPYATTSTQRFLRDLVFSRWRDDGCETLVDTKKAVGAIDVFAPFLPLTEHALRLVVQQHLVGRARDKCDARVMGDAALASLTWDGSFGSSQDSQSGSDGTVPSAAGSILQNERSNPSSRNSVIDFLVTQVEIEGHYAVEGGKEIPAVLSRWVTRALRKKALLLKKKSAFSFGNAALGGENVLLLVSKNGKELEAVVVETTGTT